MNRAVMWRLAGDNYADRPIFVLRDDDDDEILGGRLVEVGRNIINYSSKIATSSMPAMVARWQNFIAPTPSTLAQSKERKGSNFAV